MIDDVVQQGTAARAGYQHVEWEVLLKNTPLGDHRGRSYGPAQASCWIISAGT
ncbi:MAG: hypothetical protein HC869_14180 [Rhodospirillales bacterium]|nr:hypothetical protein [Rhodospirillales bacterium]